MANYGYLLHSAKGSEWKKHKYKGKHHSKNGKTVYEYADDVLTISEQEDLFNRRARTAEHLGQELKSDIYRKLEDLADYRLNKLNDEIDKKMGPESGYSDGDWLQIMAASGKHFVQNRLQRKEDAGSKEVFDYAAKQLIEKHKK